MPRPLPMLRMDLKALRILEVGDRRIFANALPEQTTLFWTGLQPLPPHPGWHNFSPAHAPALAAALRGEACDVIVCHPPSHHPFSPRVVGRLLTRSPLVLRATLARLAGTLRLQRGARVPLAVMDSHDHRRLHPRLLAAATVYFKRELDPAVDHPKVRPVSVGLSGVREERIPREPLEKTADIFFAGAAGHSRVRREGLAQLQALKKEGVRVDLVEGRLDQQEFFRRCASAWLTWSPEGLGWDCFRHYEAAACRSVPVINAPTIRPYRPLEDGEHAFYYSPGGDGLAATIRRALGDRERLRAMGDAARRHVLRYHAHPELCRMILEAALAG